MKTPSRKYWERRAEQRVVREEQLIQRYEQELKAQFEGAYADLTEQITKLYATYARDNEMTYAEAQKYLTDEDREEFQHGVEYYIAAMQDRRHQNAATRKREKAELQALSTRARVKRIEAMRADIQMQSAALYSRISEQMASTLTDVYDETRARVAYDTFQGFGIGVEFGQANPRVMEQLLQYPWSGKNYSEKIWDQAGNLSTALEQTLTRGLVQGQSIQQMTANLSRTMFGDGRRTGGQLYQAQRLVRTEANYVINQATENAYTEMGVEQYQYLATLDSLTSELCQELDGQVFPVSEAVPGKNYPPMHPNCRSTTIPYFEDLGGERIARGADGKTYTVPGDMTYETWYNEHGPGKEAAVKAEAGAVKTEIEPWLSAIPAEYHAAIIDRVKGMEPAERSLLQAHSGAIAFETLTTQSRVAFYDPDTQKITLNAAADALNPQGNWATLMHEAGHAIDHRVGRPSSEASFALAIRADAQSYQDGLKDKHPSLSSAQLRRRAAAELHGPEMSSVSDLMGGASNNRYVGSYQHQDDYWVRDSKKLAREAFAHFFEAASDRERRTTLERYFPETAKVYDELIREVTRRGQK